VGAGSIAAIAWAVRAPWVFVGWFWFIGTLVPVIGLVQVGSQSHADRYTYIPSIGLCIAVVWTLGAAMRRRPRVPPVAAAAASVVLATLLILTHRQISTWRDTPTLMAHAIAVVPNNYAAHNNLGAWLHARGDDAGAMREFESVLRINPNDVIALNNYAARLAAAGDVARAKELLKTAIRRNPKFIPAYIQLGDLYVKESRLDDAVLVYRQARDQDREDPHALHALALALAQQGKLPEAIENWQFAVALNPTDPELQHHLGVALAMAGQARQGIEHLRRALSIAPDRRETLVRLAWILATHPDPGIRAPVEAERLARRAMNLANPPDATTLDTLAAAQAANGRFTDAVETARQALQRALDADDKPLVTAIAKRLTLYESGRPAIQGQ
jgi:tetratricopeptide (TPR) repeat protein